MNPYDHRPIKFNGTPLAPSMMGVSIIECLIDVPEDVADWLWRLPICKGVEKSSGSDMAIRAAGYPTDGFALVAAVVASG
jgi:hypothetical protein